MDDLDFIILNNEVQQLITNDQAWHYRVIPKSIGHNFIELFVENTFFTEDHRAELELLTGKEIKITPLSSDKIKVALGTYYRRKHPSSSPKTVEIEVKHSEDFLNRLIFETRELGSSDIHIETYKEKCRIRIRIDGLLIEKCAVRKLDYPGLINKIKIKANLDISEKRLPQDGRIYFQSGQHQFDIRVSVLPTLYGEKIVLRLLNNEAGNIDIYQLGFSEKQLSDYLLGIKKTHGIVLISGPTGSGKTTTLYATLKILNNEKTNILTIEDPVEYTLEGVNQVQLKEAIGLNFAGALKTFLRQDPDIIMLGEIRDSETAQMAIRASLTGHLVLSTIHTNSAWGTVSRLVDMGVPPFLLASTLNTTAAQRLIRLLCPGCKELQPLENSIYPPGFTPYAVLKSHYIAKGCEHCFYTGYKGRKAVYEIIPIDYELADQIKNNHLSIDSILKNRNITTLSQNAFRLFEEGLTSMNEIYPILLNSY